MAEVRSYAPSVLVVLATPEACDHVAGLPGAGRVAPAEALIVGDVSRTAIERAVRLVDPDAVVADVSDGWAGIALDAEGAREVFTRLSELELPPRGFTQGEVARVGVRIFVEGDRIDLLVPAMLADHVRSRIQTDAEELLR